MTSNVRLRNLQALRAAAATVVVFVHLNALLATIGLKGFERSPSGINVFFVISGFVMVYTTYFRRPTFSKFLRNRVARIVPIYWLVTISVFSGAIFIPSAFQTTTASLPELFKSLLFIPFAKSSGAVQPTLFVGWTINYEMFFYGLFSLCFVLPDYRLGLTLVGVALVILWYCGIIFAPTRTLVAFYTNPRLLEFVFGIGIGVLFSMTSPAASDRRRYFALTLLVLSLVVIVVAPNVWVLVTPVLTAGVPSVVAVLAAVSLEGWGWSIKTPSILAVGDASYAGAYI